VPPETADELKRRAGRAALAHVPDGAVVGVGTGSTVNHFIDALATAKHRIAGAVSSSEASSERLRRHGIAVLETAAVERLPVYVDGADEIDRRGRMIKGGGGALTREKIVADLAERFVCIADHGKLVDVLGGYPLPVEVVAMAAPQIARRFAAHGGTATLRRRDDGEPVLTDNGHPLLDVRGLVIADPLRLEDEINQWPGVVTCGIFARHKASLCLLGTPDGVTTLTF
jgi:ribose 5-phosphate isomerase A